MYNGDRVRSYSYDHANRLTQVTKGSLTTQFAYNGDGVRMSKTVTGDTTEYALDLAATLPVVISDTEAVYLCGLDVIAQQQAERLYYVQDGLGSVRHTSTHHRRIRMDNGVPMHCGVLISLLLCFLISGCQTEEHFFDVTGDLVVLSAGDHYDEALDRAKQWREDAYLSGVFVSPTPSEERARKPWLVFDFDSLSTSEGSYVVEFDGEAWRSWVRELGPHVMRPTPIGRDDWSVDSIDAWSIALANGGEDFLLHYQEPMTGMGVQLSYRRVGSEHLRLEWTVDFSILFGPSLKIFIDPHTGDIIETEERSTSGTLVAPTPTRPPTPLAPVPVVISDTEAVYLYGLDILAQQQWDRDPTPFNGG